MLLKFVPLLKQTIWGGDKIIPFKHIGSDLTHVGESWEISGVKGRETIVSNGQYKGLKLNDLVATMKERLVGEDNYEHFGDEFPLLIKFIDAREHLSIQVHPDNDTALRLGYPRGKNEMWYIMPSDKNATLLCGLKKKITPEEYRTMVANDTITDAINEYPVKEGDCFFIPSGRIHSIGPGTFLAEIQQTSDVTFRIYDFKRKDKDGNYRQLHINEASESIDYNVRDDYRTYYEHKANEPMVLVDSPFFTTTLYDLTEPMEFDYSALNTFVILIGVGGTGTVTDNEGNEETLNAGETILVPAETESLEVSGNLKFLETYV